MKYYVMESATDKNGTDASLVHIISNEDSNEALNQARSTWHSICSSKNADANVDYYICTITSEAGALVISEAIHK